MTLASILLDPLVRRKTKLHETPLDRYQVRIARTEQEYTDAFRLVHAAYVWQGIENVRSKDLRISPQHVVPETTVLVAYEGENLVGTMTVVLDSKAGLPLDKDYQSEIDALRRHGARLVEYSAFAVVQRCWHTGVSNLLYLAANNVTTSLLNASHVVIGVHPRAKPFYRAVFNFGVLGAVRQHAELEAPVVGLVQDLQVLRSFLTRFHRKPMRTGHLPVDHFFGAPLACLELPRDMSTEAFVQWKTSTDVVQRLVAKKGDVAARAASRRQTLLHVVREETAKAS